MDRVTKKRTEIFRRLNLYLNIEDTNYNNTYTLTYSQRRHTGSDGIAQKNQRHRNYFKHKIGPCDNTEDKQKINRQQRN